MNNLPSDLITYTIQFCNVNEVKNLKKTCTDMNKVKITRKIKNTIYKNELIKMFKFQGIETYNFFNEIKDYEDCLNSLNNIGTRNEKILLFIKNIMNEIIIKKIKFKYSDFLLLHDMIFVIMHPDNGTFNYRTNLIYFYLEIKNKNQGEEYEIPMDLINRAFLRYENKIRNM